MSNLNKLRTFTEAYDKDGKPFYLGDKFRNLQHKNNNVYVIGEAECLNLKNNFARQWCVHLEKVYE